jgi:hypothetical protein
MCRRYYFLVGLKPKIKLLLCSRLRPVHDLVDQTVILGLFSRHVVIPFGIGLDLLQRLASRVCQDLVDLVPGLQDLFSSDLDIRLLTLGTA